MVSTFTWRQVTQATKRQANSGVKKGRKVKAVKARKPDRVEVCSNSSSGCLFSC